MSLKKGSYSKISLNCVMEGGGGAGIRRIIPKKRNIIDLTGFVGARKKEKLNVTYCQENAKYMDVKNNNIKVETIQLFKLFLCDKIRFFFCKIGNF